MSIAAVAAAIAAGRSGAAPIRDVHVCSGAVSGHGWSGRYCGGAARVAERFFAPLLRSTVVLSGFGGSVLCCFFWFVLPREREEREVGREEKEVRYSE